MVLALGSVILKYQYCTSHPNKQLWGVLRTQAFGGASLGPEHPRGLSILGPQAFAAQHNRAQQHSGAPSVTPVPVRRTVGL